jgi:hypothetical protein
VSRGGWEKFELFCRFIMLRLIVPFLVFTIRSKNRCLFISLRQHPTNAFFSYCGEATRYENHDVVRCDSVMLDVGCCSIDTSCCYKNKSRDDRIGLRLGL